MDRKLEVIACDYVLPEGLQKFKTNRKWELISFEHGESRNRSVPYHVSILFDVEHAFLGAVNRHAFLQQVDAATVMHTYYHL